MLLSHLSPEELTSIFNLSDDLDLHVITPGGNEIFYQNPSADAGMLDNDDIPPSFGSWVENIFFPVDGSAPNGTYTYFVVNFNQTGSADTWTLQVLTVDEIIASQSGVTVGDGAVSTRYTFEFDP